MNAPFGDLRAPLRRSRVSPSLEARLRQTDPDGQPTGFTGLVSGLAAGPMAVARATRRTRRTALFLGHGRAHIEKRLVPLPDGPVTSLRRQRYNSFMAENVCAIDGFDVRVSGPVPRGPVILVCNHTAWQDPILIANVVPAQIVAKSEVEAWPFLGDLARGLGHMFLERGSAHSGARVLLRARELLDHGCSVLTFSEGTTTRGDEVLPLHRGIFGLAQITGVSLIPMALTYEIGAEAAWIGDDSFVPHFLETVARPRTVAYLDFGEAMDLREGERAGEFAERTRGRMTQLLEARNAALDTIRPRRLRYPS